MGPHASILPRRLLPAVGLAVGVELEEAEEGGEGLAGCCWEDGEEVGEERGGLAEELLGVVGGCAEGVEGGGAVAGSEGSADEAANVDTDAEVGDPEASPATAQTIAHPFPLPFPFPPPSPSPSSVLLKYPSTPSKSNTASSPSPITPLQLPPSLHRFTRKAIGTLGTLTFFLLTSFPAKNMRVSPGVQSRRHSANAPSPPPSCPEPEPESEPEPEPEPATEPSPPPLPPPPPPPLTLTLLVAPGTEPG